MMFNKGVENKAHMGQNVPRNSFTAVLRICTFTAGGCSLLAPADCTGCCCCTSLHPTHGCVHLGGTKLTARGRNTSHPKLLIQKYFTPSFSLPVCSPFSSPRRQGASPPPPQLRLFAAAVGRRGRR